MKELKELYEAPEMETVCFLSRQKLALMDGEGGELGTGTVESDTDIELPL